MKTIYKSFDKYTQNQKRCRDCAYLTEDENGNWVCDDCGKCIEDITDDECSANEEV